MNPVTKGQSWGDERPHLLIVILSFSFIAVAMAGVFALIGDDDSFEVSGSSSGTFGNGANWTLGDGGTLTITGSGEIESSAFKNNTNIKEVVIENGITRIGGYAFYGCNGLTTINMPNSVTSIGENTFSGCSKLTSITIPDSVTSIADHTFYECNGLTTVNIPNSLTSIGGYAFYGCSKLTSITIPDSVTSIGGYAFYGCGGLTTINMPNSVTSIADHTFSGCSRLTSITMPDSVTSIGTAAFSGCSGLTTITISNSVTSIGTAAFSGCSGLTSITIPDSVTSIGESAFYGCGRLETITIPDSVTSIGKYAFHSCTALLWIHFSKNLTSMTDAFPNHRFYEENEVTKLDLANLSDFAGYEFAGSDVQHMIRAGSTTTVKHKVTYDIGEGSGQAPTQDDVQQGKKFIVARYDGTKGDLYFAGWSYNNGTYHPGDEIVMGTSDITLTAIWNPVKHKVAYVLDGGSGQAPTQDPVQEKQEFEVKGYSGTKTGYAFGGWSYNKATYNEGDRIVMGKADIALTAIWTPEKVTFDHSNLKNATGKQDSELKLLSGMEIGSNTRYIQLPDTAGYRHIGWIVDGEGVGPTAEFVKSASHTAVSVWSKINTFVPILDNRDDEPVIPVFPDQTSGDDDDSASVVIIVAGCVVVLLAIIALVDTRDTKK